MKQHITEPGGGRRGGHHWCQRSRGRRRRFIWLPPGRDKTVEWFDKNWTPSEAFLCVSVDPLRWGRGSFIICWAYLYSSHHHTSQVPLFAAPSLSISENTLIIADSHMFSPLPPPRPFSPTPPVLLLRRWRQVGQPEDWERERVLRDASFIRTESWFLSSRKIQTKVVSVWRGKIQTQRVLSRTGTKIYKSLWSVTTGDYNEKRT